ncbi:hypothetical protein Tco_0586802 [Tanacetum coccineum]
MLLHHIPCKLFLFYTPYEVIHPPSVIDYDDKYQGELQGDSQEDKLITAIMLLAQAISQNISTPTDNRLCFSSNTRNQVVVQDGRVDIQTKNAGYGGNANKNAGRNKTQGFNAGDERHYARQCQKPKVRDAKYFREQMLLAMKYEAGDNLSNEENDFMLDISYRGRLEELTRILQVHASSKVHEQVSHGKHKTSIQTTDDDQIDSNIIFDDPFVENNGGTSEHDSTAHDEYREIQMLAYNVQCDESNAGDESNQIIQHVPRTESTPGKANAMKDEAGANLSNEENDFMLDISYREDLEELTTSVMLMARLLPADENAETVASYDAKAVSQLKRKKDLLQRELETFKDRVKTIESKTIQYSTYKETCNDVERELRNDKDTIDRLVKEKEKIQNDFFKVEKEKIIIQHETQLEKKAFKEREDRYLDDILDLEEKLSYHDRSVYKIGQSIQTIHMLGKKPNKVYDPFLKAVLGYTNPVRLKKAITAQPKMYDGDLIHSNKLGIHTTDSEETLEDAEESQNKMRHKMVQIDYEKLNALYETFVPQQELSAEQTYFSIPSTSDNGSTSKDVPSESPERRWLSDSQNELREFYKTDVIPMSRSLYKTLSEIKEELIEEVQEMLNIFVSMEQKSHDKSPTEITLENEICSTFEASFTSEIRNYVLLSVEQQKHELLKVELEKSTSDSRDIQANLLKRIKILENDFQRSQAQSIDFELKLQHQKEKMDLISLSENQSWPHV